MSAVPAKISMIGAINPGYTLEVQLTVGRGPSERRRFERCSQLTVGRDPACTLALNDLTVSRKHAILFFEDSELRVEDVSTNGSFAGSVFIQKRACTLAYGSRIRLGQTELIVMRLTQDGGPFAQLTPDDEPTTRDVVVDEDVRPASDQIKTDPGDPKPITTNDEIDALRRRMHHQLLEQLDMSAIDTGTAEDPTLRPRVLDALRRIVDAIGDKLPAGLSRAALVGQMADEALGLGPLEALLADPSVSEIMVLDAHNNYVEKSGRVSLSDCRFTDDERVRAVIERIVAPLGRRVDESSPLVDARLANGSRVNVVIRPVALRGSCITIRKFSSKPFDLSALVERGALSDAMARFLVRSVKAKKNIVISGGTGSGKTTLLNVLSGAIPSNERIVTIEDAAELQLGQPHVVALESRPANMEGKGEISIRALVKNALRMRPDRIVVGECRGGEALDMLQAMNTGHDGSLTTTHANSPEEALLRLETLALMAGVGLPQLAIREQISKSVHLIVQQSRLSDGSRKLTAIVEIAGLDPRGRFLVRPIFQFNQRGTGPDGAVLGEFASTGYLPSYLPELLIKGLISEGEAFV